GLKAVELANAGQLTVNRGLIFTMSLESLLDRRRPAVHCTRRPPRREQMACRFRLLDPKGDPHGHDGRTRGIARVVRGADLRCAHPRGRAARRRMWASALIASNTARNSSR